MRTRVTVDMKPIRAIQTKIGVTPDGDVQKFTTSTINRRIEKYMPFRSGALSTKLKYIADPTEIVVLGPYARVMYYGVVMVDPVTKKSGFLTEDGWKSRTKSPHIPKVKSNRTFNYDTTKHPKAGPFWDKRMMADERGQIVAEIQAYVDRRAR